MCGGGGRDRQTYRDGQKKIETNFPKYGGILVW